MEDGQGLPLITMSTTGFRCHWFMSKVLQTTPIQNCLYTVSTTMLCTSVTPGASSEVQGTEATQVELQCHHAENHWKPRKSMPCPVRGRFCSRCKLCSNWGTLSSTCSSMSLSKLLSWSKLTMLVEWGLLGVQWHIVMLLYAKDLHETYWCHWKSSKFEHLSDIHKERVLKCALEVSKHLDYHWWHWCGMIYSS